MKKLAILSLAMLSFVALSSRGIAQDYDDESQDSGYDENYTTDQEDTYYDNQSYSDDNEALDQARDIEYNSGYAADSNNDEDARYYSGAGFDNNDSAPPPVDLRDSETLTPQLLRSSDDNDNPYIPQQYRSLHTTPPPLPQ